MDYISLTNPACNFSLQLSLIVLLLLCFLSFLLIQLVILQIQLIMLFLLISLLHLILAHFLVIIQILRLTNLWHNYLGHPSAKTISDVLCTCNIFFYILQLYLIFAMLVVLGKIPKYPFTNSSTTYFAPLELIHSDFWGPSQILSSSGYKYYVHFVDAFSKFT